jgi:hypothetical protein
MLMLLQHGTGNFWIDNGLVVLSRLLTNGNLPAPLNPLLQQLLAGDKLPADVNPLLQQLAEQVYQQTGKTEVYWDEQSQQIKTYNKRNWQEPIGLFISVVDSPPKKQVNDKELFTRPPNAASLIRINPRGKTKCDLCGVDEVPIESARLYLFPFVVDPGKFGNFYSVAKRGVKLCPRCAVAGFAAFQSWLWRRQGNTYHFFVFHTDLERLSALHESVLSPLRLAEVKGGNFEVDFFGEYPSENLFALLLSLFKFLHARESGGEVSPLLAELTGAQPVVGNPIVVYAFSGEGGKSFSMRAFTQFDRFQLFYRLYRRWIEALSANNPHSVLAQVFRQFQHKRQRTETIWREWVCSAMLKQIDPSPSIEAFLYDVCTEIRRALSYGTLEMLRIYLQEVLKMDEKLLNILKGFGYELGRVAAEKSEMGLLYALRNAKNLDQFLDVLNQIQFTLEKTINPELLRVEHGERIAGAPWNRVKTLLAIHAMNAYLRTKYPTSEAQSQEEVSHE